MSGSLHEALDHLATQVRPVDLAPRVSAGMRRRRQRRVAAVAGAALVVLGATALAVTHLDTRSLRDATVPTVSPTPSRRVVVGPAPDAFDALWTAQPGAQARLYGRHVDGTTADLGPLTALMRVDELSPDGRKVAYAYDRTIVVVTLKDFRRSVIDMPFPSTQSTAIVSWSPDGRTLAVADPVDTIAYGAGSRGFYLVDVATRHATRVAYEFRHDTIAWSPDGTRLALTNLNGSGVDVVTLTGTRVRRYDFPTFARVSSNHAWSPDGTRLLVMMSAESPSTYTEVLSLDSGEEAGRLPAGYRYVWRDITHVACWCTENVLDERSLDGTRTRTLVRVDGQVYDAVIRPAS